MAEVPTNEDMRLAALDRLGLLDTPPEQAYDDVVELARRLLDAPIALVSLVHRDRQWFKAKAGLDACETSRGVSFCAHAIAQPDLTAAFVVPDASADPRFAANPLVTGPPHIRMYVGVPIVLPGGLPVGALCVIDRRPRRPTPDQVATLRTLARTVAGQVALRDAAADLRESEGRLRLVVDAAEDAVVSLTPDGRVADWNARAEALFGRPAAEAVGRDFAALAFGAAGVGPDADAVLAAAARGEAVAVRRDGSTFPAEVTYRAAGGARFAFVRDASDRRRAEALARDAATRDVAIFALAKLAESRDPETGAHLERVQAYCRTLGEHLRAAGAFPGYADDEFVDLLHTTSPLHDIGKVGIPDAVLLKPGRLTAAEFEVMKTHAAIGAATLDAAMARFPKTRFLSVARNIAATHHERWDGTGYPAGLRGTDIPLCGRVVAVADVYDALTSRRVYKPAYPHAVARRMVLAEAGKHFDPAVVAAFAACEAAFAEAAERLRDPPPPEVAAAAA